MRKVVSVAVVVAGLLVGPAFWSGDLVGSAAAETFGHAWVRWWTALTWPALAQGTKLAVGAGSWPVIDPLPTWLFGGAARLLGDTAAWNLCAFSGILVTAIGGARLSKALGGSPEFGAVLSPLTPIYLGSVQSGLTEDYFLGFVGFSLADALENRWLRAGFWAGIASWCGLYLGWFAGVGLATIAAFRAIKWARAAFTLRGIAAAGSEAAGAGGAWGAGNAAQERTAAAPPSAPAPPIPRFVSLQMARLPLAGMLLAVALSLVAAWPFLGRLSGQPPMRPDPASEPLYVLNPWRAADLASFVTPGRNDTGGAIVREHPTYLGYSTLGLAMIGGWHPAFAAVLLSGAAALGDPISIAGKPTDIPNPVAEILHILPMGDRFRNHARLMLLGQLLLVGLASRGAKRVAIAAGNHPALGTGAGIALAAAVVILETRFGSPAALPLATTSTRAPAIYAKLPAGGRPLRVFGERNPQKPFFDQRFHSHPLKNDPNRPDAGKPKPDSEIIVVFGVSAGEWATTLGPPDASADGYSAWWP